MCVVHSAFLINQHGRLCQIIRAMKLSCDVLSVKKRGLGVTGRYRVLNW